MNMKATAEHLHKAANIVGSSEFPKIEDYGLPIKELEKFIDQSEWHDSALHMPQIELQPLALAIGISIGFIAGHDFVEHRDHHKEQA